MMELNKNNVFKECFAGVKDPRIDRKRLYPLEEILFVVLCGTICGAESWRDFVIFGKEKLNYLKRFFEFKNGISSKDTFARVLSTLHPEQLRYCLLEWIKSLQEVLKGVVAIDGKAVRRSFDKVLGQNPIHIVSAFSTELRLMLGQEKVAEKSNEIKAIPKLLELLDLAGSIVTIDAMGCQKKIAAKIREGEADYILALKGNHGNLLDDVRLFMEMEVEKSEQKNCIDGFNEEVDAGHGRIETRRCYVSEKIDWISGREEWKDLKSIVMIESRREIKEEISIERRFYISNLSADAKLIGDSVRAHWGVENQLHWILDVTFREDESRVRKNHAPENMSLIRRWTLNMLQNTRKKYKGISIKGLRKKAGWGNSTLDAVLQGNF